MKAMSETANLRNDYRGEIRRIWMGRVVEFRQQSRVNRGDLVGIRMVTDQ